MTVEQLRDILNTMAESVYWEQYKKSIVVITTKDNSGTIWGYRPYTPVKSAMLGFDWEMGQFRIEPENNLMEVK